MELIDEVREVLGDALGLGARLAHLGPDSRLLGAIPEFDSMAVVELIAGLEARFGFTVADDEIDASVFESLATLVAFVAGKLGA